MIHDHPTLHEMLAPTLHDSDRRPLVLVSPYTRTAAVVALRPDTTTVEIGLACLLHALLGRGLLVLA